MTVHDMTEAIKCCIGVNGQLKIECNGCPHDKFCKDLITLIFKHKTQN